MIFLLPSEMAAFLYRAPIASFLWRGTSPASVLYLLFLQLQLDAHSFIQMNKVMSCRRHEHQAGDGFACPIIDQPLFRLLDCAVFGQPADLCSTGLVPELSGLESGNARPRPGCSSLAVGAQGSDLNRSTERGNVLSAHAISGVNERRAQLTRELACMEDLFTTCDEDIHRDVLNPGAVPDMP